jgi:uncharacterized protein YciI
MLFLAEIENHAGMEDVRQANKEAHIAYLKKAHGTVRAAANLKDSLDGETVGIIWIIEAPDKVAARKAIEDDPFYRAGLRRSVKIRHFIKSVTDRTAEI